MTTQEKDDVVRILQFNYLKRNVPVTYVGILYYLRHNLPNHRVTLADVSEIARRAGLKKENYKFII